jgi:uncharacterized protein YeaC (DUF1315 family)
MSPHLMSIADMIFQNFDIALYIKEFISSKYALPYYLTCKSTMSTSRNKDNEYDEIETYMDGFYSSPLLRWALNTNMPITRRLFAEVCSRGVLNDVKLLLKKMKCSCDDLAFRLTIANGQLHVLKYLCNNSPKDSVNGHKLCYFAIENGKVNILEWLWSKYAIEEDDWPDFYRACEEAAKYNHMNVLMWLQSKSNIVDQSHIYIYVVALHVVHMLQY